MSWLFGPKESKIDKAARKAKEKKAYLQAYEQAKIQRAKQAGRRAGSTSTAERLLGGFQRIDAGLSAGNQVANNLLGSDFGFGGSTPRKRTQHRKRKGKTITIHVK